MPEQLQPVGALVMAHGTPSALEELEAFLTHIRHGRRPSTEQLADLRRRYDAIGGISPLTATTHKQVEGIGQALERRSPGGFTVRYGARHVAPFVEDAAADLLAQGVRGVVGLVLTPHRSSMGSEDYLQRAHTALAGRVPFAGVTNWYARSALVRLWAERVRDATDSAGTGPQTAVVFSSHALPQRIRERADPYESQVADSARLVARAAGAADWRVAWQSAGRTPEPWIGPDLLEVIGQLAEEGMRNVVVCPIGFVADHLEVLYDLDIEARGVATAAGLRFERTSSFNDDPRFLAVLADVIVDAARDLATPPRRDGGGARHECLDA